MRTLIRGLVAVAAWGVIGAGAAAAAGYPATLGAIPSRFVGVWHADAAHCHASDDEMALTIKPTSLAFLEGHGAVTRVVQTGPNDITVTVSERSEGETSTSTYKYRLSADGSQLSDADPGAEGPPRHRCA